MKEPRDLWKVDGAATAPRLVTGTEHPDKDSEGQTIFHNRHYPNKDGAWDWLERDSEAGMSLLASRITELRARLRRSEQEAADEIVRHATIRANREAEAAKDGGK